MIESYFRCNLCTLYVDTEVDICLYFGSPTKYTPTILQKSMVAAAAPVFLQ